jgi:hypothetical protein
VTAETRAIVRNTLAYVAIVVGSWSAVLAVIALLRALIAGVVQ